MRAQLRRWACGSGEQACAREMMAARDAARVREAGAAGSALVLLGTALPHLVERRRGKRGSAWLASPNAGAKCKMRSAFTSSI